MSAVGFKHSVGIALATDGIAGRVHLDAKRIGHGVCADSAETIKLACHLRDVDSGHWSSSLVLWFTLSIKPETFYLRLGLKRKPILWHELHNPAYLR